MSFICIPMRMNLIKARGGKSSRPFSFERLAIFPPQADHVLVDLFFIRGGPGGCVKAPRHLVPAQGPAQTRGFKPPSLQMAFILGGPGGCVKAPQQIIFTLPDISFRIMALSLQGFFSYFQCLAMTPPTSYITEKLPLVC